MMRHLRNRLTATFIPFIAVLVLFTFVTNGCDTEPAPAWKAQNDPVIEEHDLKVRTRSDMKGKGVEPNLEPGKVTNLKDMPTVTLAEGVTAKVYWGKGAMVSFVTMEPDAVIPEETLSSERLMVMNKGSLQQMVNGSYVDMAITPVEPLYYFSTGLVGHRDALFLEKGAQNGVKAGPDGAEFVEIYSPVRLDYMEKAGAEVPQNPDFGDFGATPNFPANEVFDYYDIQYTQLVPKDGSEFKSDANTRLFNGTSVQGSFLFMNPGSFFGHHIHPEDQLMVVLQGSIEEIIMDGATEMTEGDVVYLPGNMVHGGTNGPDGALVIDVFWPVRPDYYEMMEKRRALFHSVIPEDAEPELIADGQKDKAENYPNVSPSLIFTEGPAWLDGKLYFSSMYFDANWAGDPSRSALVEMAEDGAFKYAIYGEMQTNGIMPMGNGNLAVCDMFGHRVIEMQPDGKVVNVLAKTYNGKSLDGPNDLVIDAKGGIYFTDPQFTPDEVKNQPAKCVYYRKPDGELIRVIDNVNPRVFGMPNGVLLSPDGKTLYVNNTYHNPQNPGQAENWVYAYDVKDDGTLANERKFAELFLPPSEYAVEDFVSRSSTADGMTIDAEGNLYVATNIGLQIFNPKGEYIGNVHTPVFPVSAAFGGSNFDTVYMTCWDQIWKIKTNVKGLEYPLK